MADSLVDLTARLHAFAVERDWERFHTPKNLAMALAGEVGELLAELQWLTPEEAADLDDDTRRRVAAEMADVLLYLTRLAGVLNIDLLDAANAKIVSNAERYPAATNQGVVVKEIRLTS